MRYLVLAYAQSADIYPQTPRLRAGVDRWLDWTLSTLQPVERPLFWGLVRTPADQRDMTANQQSADAAALQWRIIDRQLEQRDFVEGEQFTLADIALGAYARRWIGLDGIVRPSLPHLARWYAQLAGRPGFQQFIAPPLS